MSGPSDREGDGNGERRDDAPRSPVVTDLVVSTILALLAAGMAMALPDGNRLRWVAAAPILFFVPGYLVMQLAVVPAAPPRRRVVHGIAAIGLSPAVVGLLALSTALIPGGFRPPVIIAVVTGACLVLAGAAYYRRATVEASPASGESEPEEGPMPRVELPSQGGSESDRGEEGEMKPHPASG